MNIAILASGSTGNCTLVSEGSTHLLIDAGISAKRIREGLARYGVAPGELSAILVTHEHADHISGLNVLLRRCAAPVYTIAPVERALRAELPEYANRYFPLELDCAFLIAGLAVTPFRTMHDSAGSCGWRICGMTGSFGFCTDLGVVTEAVLCAMQGVDCAVIEANHDLPMLLHGPYPAWLKRRVASDFGHLSNDAAAELAVLLAQSGTRTLILGHLSRHNNTPAKAREAVLQALLTLPEPLQPALFTAPEAGGLALEIGALMPC